MSKGGTPKKGATIAGGKGLHTATGGQNPLTNAEMEHVVTALCEHVWQDEEAADLLALLLWALAEEDDEDARSQAYYTAQRQLVHAATGITEAYEANHARLLAEIREGGKR
jgi:hypothetical protein